MSHPIYQKSGVKHAIAGEINTLKPVLEESEHMRSGAAAHSTTPGLQPTKMEGRVGVYTMNF